MEVNAGIKIINRWLVRILTSANLKGVHHSIQSTEWLGGGELTWSTTLSSGIDQLFVKLSRMDTG
jgi:hypothetical protein